MYITDLSRLLPAAPIDEPRSHLYKMFRPEMCKSVAAVSLSSDALSGYGAVGAEQHNSDVHKLHATMMEHDVTKVITSLASWLREKIRASQVIPGLLNDQIKAEKHAA